MPTIVTISTTLIVPPSSAVPSTPAAGAGGVLYTKADRKPYWKSDDVAETDLTSGGGGVDQKEGIGAWYNAWCNIPGGTNGQYDGTSGGCFIPSKRLIT